MGVISGMDRQIESRGVNKEATDYHYYICMHKYGVMFSVDYRKESMAVSGK